MQQQVVNKKDRREGKGRTLALSREIYRTSDNLFYVESESTDKIYYTCKYQPSESFVLEWCTCADYMSNRATRCKHIYAVKYALEQKTIKQVNKFSSIAASISITRELQSQPEQEQKEKKSIYDGDEYTF